MSMINAHGTTNGSAYAMWSVMLYGTCKQTDHGCTRYPTSMMSLRSQPLSSASLLKNKPREQHECTNLMHSDLGRVDELFDDNPHGNEMNQSQKGLAQFLIPRGNASKLLEVVEETFNLLTELVEVFIIV